MPIVSDITLDPGEKKRGWTGKLVSQASVPSVSAIHPDIQEVLRAEKQWVGEGQPRIGRNRIYWTVAPEPTRAPVPEYIAAVESSVLVDGKTGVNISDITGARFAVFRQVLEVGIRLSVIAVREGLLPEAEAEIEGVAQIDLTHEDPLADRMDEQV